MPRLTVLRHADALLVALAGLSITAPVAVTHQRGGLRVTVEVRPVRRASTARNACKQDVLRVLREAGRPLKWTVIAHRLRGVHGTSTVRKALADLTRSGTLRNPRDGRGYRIPGDSG